MTDNDESDVPSQLLNPVSNIHRRTRYFDHIYEISGNVFCIYLKVRSSVTNLTTKSLWLFICYHGRFLLWVSCPSADERYGVRQDTLYVMY